MKSISIKKAAAVAAGTALLVGAALAVVPDAAKNKAFYWDTNGNTNVQIVTGSNALISDGVNAAKLAAVVGGKAYTTTGGSVTPDATGTVKLKIAGSTAIPTSGTYMDKQEVDSAISLTTDALTLGEAHGLKKGTFSFMNTEYDYKETVSVANTVRLQYEEDKDYHGVYLENTGANTIYYRFDFIKNLAYSDSKKNQTIEIPFLGENYLINKNTQSELHLVKGEKVSLGIGQSTDVTVNEKTYTVTLDSASLDETTNPQTGYATVTVSGGDLTSPVSVQLDTANNQDATTSGFYTYLQSVQKSYTPGQGGSATIRVGGGLLKLIDNDFFPESTLWKVNIVNNGVDTDFVDVYLNKDYTKTDKVTEITGPNDYFTLKYADTNAGRGEIEVDKITVKGGEDSLLYIINELGYTSEYETAFTVDMWDTSKDYTRAFLANATGNGNISQSAVGGGALYLPMKSGDTFFVSGNAIKINNIRYDPATVTNSYVTLNNIKHSFSNGAAVAAAARIGDGDLSGLGPYYGAYDNNTTAGATILWQNFTDVDTDQGSKTVAMAIVSDDYNDFNEDVMYVLSGAAANVASDYYNVGWRNSVWNNATGLYTTQNNTQLNITMPLATPAGSMFNVSYMKSASYEGITVMNGTTLVTYVDQNQEKASEDRYTYHELSYADLEATSGNTVEIKAFKENAKLRLQLTPGTSAGTGDSESSFTVDTTQTFPYDVTSAVTVTELGCDVTPVATGVKFGTISDNLVVSDAVDPAGNAIVIGGHYVNRLAVGMTEGTLTAAGTKMIELSGKTLYVAGYTAADTTAAVGELIAAIKAL